MGAESKTLNLGNICGGAAEEVFGRVLQEVLENVADVNTDPKKSRRVTLTFDITPSNDRSVAEVSFVCTSKLVSVPAVKASIFISDKGGHVTAYPSDQRQEKLFKEKAIDKEGKVHPIRG